MSRRAALDVAELPPIVVDSRSLLWWGMTGLIAIEGTMVALLFATYFYLRVQAPLWPPPGAHDAGLLLPTLGLLLLVASAWPMHEADSAVKRGDRRGAIVQTIVNIAMVALFLAARALEMKRLAFRWDSHAYGSIFWTILGLHTSHVLASLLESVVLVVLLLRGHFADEQRLAVRVDGLYWYFVVAAWIPLYAALYLYPRLQ